MESFWMCCDLTGEKDTTYLSVREALDDRWL